jgi:hypothetical protein
MSGQGQMDKLLKAHTSRMIPKSGYRFSDKIMRKQNV